MNTIAYSTITTLSPYAHITCCGERMFLTPCCDAEVCVFCEDTCDVCNARIDWTA